jgi:hypothetical protein
MHLHITSLYIIPPHNANIVKARIGHLHGTDLDKSDGHPRAAPKPLPNRCARKDKGQLVRYQTFQLPNTRRVTSPARMHANAPVPAAATPARRIDGARRCDDNNGLLVKGKRHDTVVHSRCGFAFASHRATGNSAPCLVSAVRLRYRFAVMGGGLASKAAAVRRSTWGRGCQL